VNAPSWLDEVLAGLTPARLYEIIVHLAQTQATDNREGVGVPAIMEALAAGRDLGSGSAGWAAHLRLRQAIRDTVALIPRLKYIEADA